MIKIYISHRISDGTSDNKKAQLENCKKAVQFADKLRKVFPNVEFYVPAEHEEFVAKAFEKEYVTLNEILDVDCDIVSTCNCVINFMPDGYLSKGMQVENTYAQMNGIPVFNMITGYEVQILQRYLESLMKG